MIMFMNVRTITARGLTAMNKILLGKVVAWIECNPGCVDAGTCDRPYVEDLPEESAGESFTRRNSLTSLVLHIVGNPIVGKTSTASSATGVTAEGESAYMEAMFSLGIDKGEMDILLHRYNGAWPKVIESRLSLLRDGKTCEILDTAAYGQALCTYLRWFMANYPNVEV